MAEQPIEIIESAENRTVLIFDLALSRAVLTSPAFGNVNYFGKALARAGSTGKPLAHVKQHWDASLLFKEGAEHAALKKKFNGLLREVVDEIRAQTPRIQVYFGKRSSTIDSALDFSKLFVRLGMGLITNNLTSIPLRRIHQAFALRRNVFCNHFMQSRHVATNAAFAHLHAGTKAGNLRSDSELRRLLAEALLTMGIDPLIGTLCASLTRDVNGDAVRDVYRHCPTSYVSRTCIEKTSLGALDFMPGDICYLALVPSEAEASRAGHASRNASLAFGVGTHACIGRQLSLVLLDIAQTVASTHFSNGFARQAVLSPDGAFLAFRSA